MKEQNAVSLYQSQLIHKLTNQPKKTIEAGLPAFPLDAHIRISVFSPTPFLICPQPLNYMASLTCHHSELPSQEEEVNIRQNDGHQKSITPPSLKSFDECQLSLQRTVSWELVKRGGEEDGHQDGGHLDRAHQPSCPPLSPCHPILWLQTEPADHQQVQLDKPRHQTRGDGRDLL